MVLEVKFMITFREGSGYKSKFYVKYIGRVLVLSLRAAYMGVFTLKNSLNYI